MDRIYTIISIGLAVAAIISPIVVSFVNNAHNKSIHIENLKHEEIMKNMENTYRLEEKHIDLEFSIKKESFSDFFKSAINYHLHPDDKDLEASFYSAAFEAASLCSVLDHSRQIFDFADSCRHSHSYFSQDEKTNIFLYDLNDISVILSEELFPKSSNVNDQRGQ